MNFLIDGLKGWLIQRLSAIFLAVFCLYLAAYFLFTPPQDFYAWQSWFKSSLNQLLFGCFFALLLLHAWVGVRDVIFDYIQPGQLQQLLLFALAVFLGACGIWSVQVLLL